MHNYEKIELAIQKIKNPDNPDPLGFVKPSIGVLELEQIKSRADYLNKKYKRIIILGIGGATLGPRAIVESYLGPHYNRIRRLKNLPDIYFYTSINSNVDHAALVQMVWDYERNDEVLVIKVSKSGATEETNRAYNRLLTLCDHIEITGSSEDELYKFDDTVGGRFSVLSRSSIFILSLFFDNVSDFLYGAYKAYQRFNNDQITHLRKYISNRIDNDFYDVAAEFISFIGLPQSRLLGQWVQQLFAETEGKNDHCPLPSPLYYPEDLHSMEQWIQDGKKNVATETLIIFNNDQNEAIKSLSETIIEAHKGAIRNNAVLEYGLTLEGLGEFVYDFMLVTAITSYALDIPNAFGQPGVEKYKSIQRRKSE